MKNLATSASQTVVVDKTAIDALTGASARLDYDFSNLGMTVKFGEDFTTGSNIAVDSNTYAAGGDALVVTAASVKVIASAGDISDINTLDVTIDSTVAATSTLSLATAGTNLTATGVNLELVGTHQVTLSRTTAGVTDSITIEFAVTTGAADADTSAVIGLQELENLVAADRNEAALATFDFKIGTGTTANDKVSVTIDSMKASVLGINATKIDTVANSDTASGAISTAIDTLSTARAKVGASQNRLEFASINLATTRENTEAARSSLMDLDVAREMSEFTSKQILVQAGVSMLAQANLMPQNLLRLFQ